MSTSCALAASSGLFVPTRPVVAATTQLPSEPAASATPDSDAASVVEAESPLLIPSSASESVSIWSGSLLPQFDIKNYLYDDAEAQDQPTPDDISLKFAPFPSTETIWAHTRHQDPDSNWPSPMHTCNGWVLTPPKYASFFPRQEVRNTALAVWHKWLRDLILEEFEIEFLMSKHAHNVDSVLYSTPSPPPRPHMHL